MNELDSLPFAIGDRIANKYRIDGLIGAGGMGVVLEATHVELERKVAVKLIRPELAADELLVERLMLEARAAAKIRSEHVGAVLDVGRLPSGAPFIVMEYLQGSDLAQLLAQRGALDVAETVDLLLGACEALASAHQQHIVHRDLKPENLFVVTSTSGERQLKVLDFGISKQLGDPNRRALTQPETAIGSPQYMAPEQMQGSAVDVRADIWAMGAILYEMLSGVRAFDGETLPIVCARVLGFQPPPLDASAPAVPHQLSLIVARCLEKEPTRRYASIAHLAEALAPFGSRRAAHSLNQVRALLGAPVPQPHPAAALDQTQVVESSGSSTAGTSKGLAIESVAPTAAPRAERPSLWPIWAGAGLAVASAIGIWFFARHELEKERLARELRELSAPSDAPLEHDTEPADTVTPGPTGAESAVVVASDAGPPGPRHAPQQRPTGTDVPTGRVVPTPGRASSRSAPTQPTSSGRGGAPARDAPRSGVTPGQSPGSNTSTTSDAWDRGSFGGRH